jgi:hypothetical protein
VVELDDEGNLVRVLARDRAEHAERRGDGVAAALDRQLDDVFRVEVDRVRREARARRVLDALVNGQDRNEARPGEPAVVEERLQVPEHIHRAVGRDPHAVNEVRAGQVQHVFGNGLAFVAEQLPGLFSEQLFYLA